MEAKYLFFCGTSGTIDNRPSTIFFKWNQLDPSDSGFLFPQGFHHGSVKTTGWTLTQFDPTTSDTLIRFSPNMASFPCSPDSESPWVRLEYPNVVCYLYIYVYVTVYSPIGWFVVVASSFFDHIISCHVIYVASQTATVIPAISWSISQLQTCTFDKLIHLIKV